MAKLKIKSGSLILELWDDANPPNVWVAQFPDAVLKHQNALLVERLKKDPGNAPDWVPDVGHGGGNVT
jgi:hypothetical protein